MDKSKIVGWSLFNSVIATEHFLFICERIKYFVAAELIEDKRYAVGQKFIIEDFRGLGLIGLSTKVLDSNCAARYDYYLASAKKDNLVSNRFLEKNHFQVFEEDEQRKYFIKKIESTKIKISQASVEYGTGLKFNIRMAENDDAPALAALNAEWHQSNIKSTAKGYLTSLYSIEDFIRIIERTELCVIELLE